MKILIKINKLDLHSDLIITSYLVDPNGYFSMGSIVL